MRPLPLQYSPPSSLLPFTLKNKQLLNLKSKLERTTKYNKLQIVPRLGRSDMVWLVTTSLAPLDFLFDPCFLFVVKLQKGRERFLHTKGGGGEKSDDIDTLRIQSPRVMSLTDEEHY